MIFRIVHGRFRECLSATPVIHEWKLRNPDDRIFVETSFPELFVNNPAVTEVGLWFDNGPVIDFDIVEEPPEGVNLIDLYALACFGDTRLSSWKMDSFIPMEKTDIDADVLVGHEFACLHRDAIDVMKTKWQVAVVGNSITGRVLTALNQARAYVGRDEDMTWLAMTTDVPIVMSCGPRLPKSCRPFRGRIPFESIAWKCEWRKACLRRFSSSSFGQLLHVYCQKTPNMACETMIDHKDLIEAVEKIIG